MFHVEQSFRALLSRRTVITIGLCIGLSGCSGPERNPELRDPIHQDLSQELSAVKAKLASEQKNLETLATDFLKSTPNTKERKILERDQVKAQRQVASLSQRLHFLELRVQRRALEAKIQYHSAYEQGSEWPIKEEIDAYWVNKRLNTRLTKSTPAAK